MTEGVTIRERQTLTTHERRYLREARESFKSLRQEAGAYCDAINEDNVSPERRMHLVERTLNRIIVAMDRMDTRCEIIEDLLERLDND